MIHPVTVELGGKTRTLHCDLGAWAAIEDYGFQVMDIMAALKDGKLSFRQTRALVAAMLWQDTVIEADVAKWVTGENFATVMAAVGKALRQAFPEAGASEEANPPGGTGRKSSSLARTAA